MSILIISDLHLDEDQPRITKIFMDFLEKEADVGITLFILGDFFESWIGDDNLTPFNQSIISALKKATDKGLKILIMQGNRDFLLGKKFMRLTGCKLIPDEYRVNINGIPTLLMHGDTLCSEDVSYLKFRKKTRNKLYQFLFLLLPLKKRRQIAEKLRQGSKAHTAATAENIMDVTQSEVEKIMVKHHVLHLIHGHTHRPSLHHFFIEGQPATRRVLAAWHDEGMVLKCEESGGQQVIILK